MAEPGHTMPEKRSPLCELEDTLREASREAGELIQLREVPFLAQINLRGDAGTPDFRQAVRSVIGFDLPVKANTYATFASVSALWLGPDEWLLVGAPQSGEDLVGQLRQHLRSIRCSVVDVSDARTVIELSGTCCRELLAKGCGLDLRPRSFQPRQCAQAIIAHAGVLLQIVDESPRWRLYVRNSLANYLASWLLDAMMEFRVREPIAGVELRRPNLFGASR